MDIPQIAPLRQTASQPAIADVAAEVRRQWRESRVAGRIRRGSRVAVAVGSRGIANLSALVRATLDSLRDLGAQPFVVAAMGSHGGATAVGQRDLLADYGISEQALGVPVKTDMTAVRIGVNSWGEPVWWDKNALESDAVITVSRVKPHTDFRGRFESGIAKMLVIGLGKRDGAAQHHRWGFRGLRDMLPETARVIVEKTPFVGGLAVLENAREQTARLQVVDRDELFDVEPHLLEEARGLMGRLPFEQLDLLVIGEIGKNYSGAGIDPNVVGRLLIETQPEFESPRITPHLRARFIAGEPRQRHRLRYRRPDHRASARRHRSAAVSHEQSDGVFSVALETALRFCQRPRLHRGGLGHLLAAQPRRRAYGAHCQYVGGRRTVGFAAADRRSATAAPSRNHRRFASAAVR